MDSTSAAGASGREFLTGLEALERAIQLAGGSQQKLADRINAVVPAERRIGPSAIGNWKLRGQVSAEMVLPAAWAVEFGVLPHEFRRDLYPNPEDGIPPERRILALIPNEILTDAERAALVAAVARGPEAAALVIQTIDVDVEQRQRLLEAAAAMGVAR